MDKTVCKNLANVLSGKPIDNNYKKAVYRKTVQAKLNKDKLLFNNKKQNNSF